MDSIQRDGATRRLDLLAEALRPTRRWPLLLGLLLAVALLYLAFRDVGWRELLDAIARAHPQYVALALGLASCSCLLRSLRWRVLLTADRPMPRRTVFYATMAGYLGNNLLPARSGELLRSVLLGRATGASKSFVLATALTERVLDALALVVIGAAALLTLPDLPDWLPSAVRLACLVGLAGLGGLLLAPRLEGLIGKALSRLPLPERLRARLRELVGHLLLGLGSLQRSGRALRFVGFTGVIWSLDGLTAMLLARGLDLTLAFPQALVLLSALGLASALPSTPGYLGINQFVAVTVLPAFGFAPSEALAYSLVSQAANYVVIVAWGSLGLWRLLRAGSPAGEDNGNAVGPSEVEGRGGDSWPPSLTTAGPSPERVRADPTRP